MAKRTQTEIPVVESSADLGEPDYFPYVAISATEGLLIITEGN